MTEAIKVLKETDLYNELLTNPTFVMQVALAELARRAGGELRIVMPNHTPTGRFLAGMKEEDGHLVLVFNFGSLQ